MAYGLIVIFKKKFVVLIKRKVPYILQQYYMNNEKKETCSLDDFHSRYLRQQNLITRLDYAMFLQNHGFEDKYDFPHGQMEFRSKRGGITLQQKWKTALREFQEETGYTFNQDLIPPIYKLPTRVFSFLGLDRQYYKQFYFIVHVDSLSKAILLDDKYHEPWVVPLEEAQQLLTVQQDIKQDNKHRFISDHDNF